MLHRAPLARALTRADIVLDDGQVLVTDVVHKRHHLLPPPHLVSQARMAALTAPESSESASSSSASSSSPASSLPTLPTAPSIAELEHKLAAALLACRAALEDVASSVSSSGDEDESDDDMSEDESDGVVDDDDDEEELEDEDDDSSDDEHPVPKPDDTYHRRMRRICAWRDDVGAPQAPCGASLKRKAGADGAECAAAIKRARLGAACAACERVFDSRPALVQHAASDACRAAVAYQLEA